MRAFARSAKQPLRGREDGGQATTTCSTPAGLRAGSLRDQGRAARGRKNRTGGPIEKLSEEIASKDEVVLPDVPQKPRIGMQLPVKSVEGR